MDDEGTRKGRRAGTGCGDKQKKGWGSHCHANWCSVQTPMSCKERLKGKVRYKRFWHRLLSRVGIVSFCEGCCRLGALVFFLCLSLFTSQVHAASTQCQAGLYLRHLNQGCCVPWCRLQAKLWLRRW